MRWRKYRILPALFIIPALFLIHIQRPQTVFAEATQVYADAEAQVDAEVAEDSATRTAKVPPGLGAHKPTYVIFTWTPYDEGREREEIKYQISFKQRVYPWGNLADEHKRFKLYFALTLKSFWQVFDRDNSSPFRETNYNPEIFARTPDFQTSWGTWRCDVGGEHESNGQNLPASRSWDRIYIKPQFDKGIFSADVKLWYRLKEDDKQDASDTQGDDNPDIEDYYGRSELNLRLDFSRRKIRTDTAARKIFYFDQSCVNLMTRYNFQTRQGAMQLDYWVPLINSMNLYFQYWNGYGESLIDYNISFVKYGGGLALTY